jgi:hypothetical protein
MKMNTSASNDVEVIGEECRVREKKIQREERRIKDKRRSSYETYNARASRGIEFEAILVYDH